MLGVVQVFALLQLTFARELRHSFFLHIVKLSIKLEVEK